MVNILNIEPDHYCLQASNLLSALGKVTEVKLTRDELLSSIGFYDVLVTCLGTQIDTEVFTRAENLKIVISNTTGLDHIDLEAARKHGVTVLSLKGETKFLESITATAEHTWGLILMLNRSTHHAHNDVLRGHWRRERFIGYELKGKRLGVVGYGRLGRMTGLLGNAFNMKVQAFDPYNQCSEVNNCDSLEELASTSDIVTLHVPLNEETLGMVSSSIINKMQNNAILINTSRGGVVDEKALLDALKCGVIRGAALDVLSGEKEKRTGDSSWPNNDPLVKYARLSNNLVLTPHIGGATVDSLCATEIFLVNKLTDSLAKTDL